MELKYKVQITEGFVYDTHKEATSKLFSSISFAIFRNGKPVTDKDVEPYRDAPAKGVVYSAALFRGGKQIASITP